MLAKFEFKAKHGETQIYNFCYGTYQFREKHVITEFLQRNTEIWMIYMIIYSILYKK